MAIELNRYDEYDAATLNAAFALLQAKYDATRNAWEPIASGTLTAATENINLDLGSTTWRELQLKAKLNFNGINAALRVNGDTDAHYPYAYIGAAPVAIDAAIVSPQTSFALGGLGAVFTDFQRGFLDCQILLDASGGMRALGTWSCATVIAPTVLRMYHFGFVYRYAAVTSIQITHTTIGGGYVFSVGDTYRLEGIPA